MYVSLSMLLKSLYLWGFYAGFYKWLVMPLGVGSPVHNIYLKLRKCQVLSSATDREIVQGEDRVVMTEVFHTCTHINAQTCMHSHSHLSQDDLIAIDATRSGMTSLLAHLSVFLSCPPFSFYKINPNNLTVMSINQC